jgi:uncharacterized protein
MEETFLGQEDLEAIALGAPILGTGGGGDPYIGKLIARQAISGGKPVRLIGLKEVPDRALVIASAMMGAPTVFVEKVPSGDEAVAAFLALQEFLDARAYATYSIEAGGLNSTIPIGTAAKLGIPLIDADGMGRAFPEIQMVSPTLYDIPATPMALADEKGDVVILENTITNLWTERLARSVTIDMGGSAMIALYPMTGKQAKKALIAGSISFARSIGNRLLKAWRTRADPLDAILSETKGYLAFRGKIVDLERRTERGFAQGTVKLDGIDEDKGKELVVRFQNENLIAELDGSVLVSVPDLIAMVDTETSVPVTTEGLRYGLRVAVIAIPCHSKWRSVKGLEIVGPGYFGYKSPYRPVERRLG